MKLSIIQSGFFKLDGGAMFGVVPKTLWSKQNPPDDKNLCTWSMRCLLIETEDRKILIDTGLGNKQDEKFMSHFEPHGAYSLAQSLLDKGVTLEEITDVFLTHLHFDHVGGAVIKNSDGDLIPHFPNATYWTNQKHYDWAFNPNYREKASFLKENFVPLHDHGVLKYIPEEPSFEWVKGINIHFSYGHTEAMMIPHITLANGNVLVYCADQLPSSFHVRMPYIMSYDIRPLTVLEEKKELYKKALNENYYLFFEHDPVTAVGQLTQNDRGKFGIDTAIDWPSITK